MLADKFKLTEEQLFKTYLLPLQVASEPYFRSFQYSVVLHCVYERSPFSVGCLWQATIRFRRVFFFFVDAKRQIWLTSNYMLRKILRFSQAVACADSVVLEATFTSSGNKQKVRHFRKDCSVISMADLTD